jgi:hypothetical protein
MARERSDKEALAMLYLAQIDYSSESAEET